VNRNPARYLAALSLFVLTACATPAETASYQQDVFDSKLDALRRDADALAEAQRAYAGELRFAERWDHHWWGIPSGGWVAIFVVVGALLTIALCVWGYYFNERRRLRQRQAHELKLQQEKTEQRRVGAAEEVVRRGNCQVCGAAPLDEKTLKELE
jgi:hypothetical protein